MSLFRISTLSISRTGLFLWNCSNLTRRFSQSAVYCFEAFIEKEFEKAQRELDTETLENPASLLIKLERDQKQKVLAQKKARTTRLFRPPQEPRKLNRDTMEQIRFLKQEHGEEWSIPKLAASFGMTETVIIKVLKSKFVPSEKRLTKQDEKAAVNAGLIPERASSAAKHGNPEKSMLTVVKTPAQPMKPGKETKGRNWQQKSSRNQYRSENMPSRRSRITSAPKEENISCEERNHYENLGPKTQMSDDGVHFRRDNVANDKSRRKNSNFVQQYDTESDTRDSHAVDEELNIDFENLSSYDDGIPPPQIVRRGNEFFDENGEFLYRV